MFRTKLCRLSMLAVAIVASVTLCSAPAQARSARQLRPVYISPTDGFVYFLVVNKGSRTINNLFGWVYGYASPVRRGVHLVNDPHASAMKVSLGAHAPGTVAMYRFMVSPDDMDFSRFMLKVNDGGLRYPKRAIMLK